jgi:hypothetical protein
VAEEAPDKPASRLQLLLSAAAAVSAGALVMALSIRTLVSPDLGYHLAYGERFLETGQLVDHNPCIYTLPDKGLPPEHRPAPGPGCWYDAQGRYRFANANWLSQVVMAAAHRYGGVPALTVLQSALVLAVFACVALAMRRLRLPWLLIATGIVLAAMVAQNRLNLRPEVFGYLILSAQLCLLAGGRISWRTVAGLVALQLLLVNLHSYFLLGPGLTGAFLVDRIARLVWRRLRTADRRGDSGRASGRGGEALRLAIILAGQTAVCFANPWTWRLAILPVQTLAFLRAHNIAGATGTIHGHPWAFIGEFFGPFAKGFAAHKATLAYHVLLAVACLGALAALLRRQWAWLIIIGAMTAVSLSMRRNIAPAALLITPIALAAIRDAALAAARRMRPRDFTIAKAVASGMLVLLAALLVVAIAGQSFYVSERRADRFGGGISRLEVPLDAAEWLKGNLPGHADGVRIFTDYNSSSNLYYFLRPHRDVPILTNTWAYPPATMKRVLMVIRGREPFGSFATQFNVQLAVLRVDNMSSYRTRRDEEPICPKLAASAAWAVVHLDARHVIFARREGPCAELAKRFGLTQETLLARIDEFIARLKATDVVAAHALLVGGTTLQRLSWYQAGARVLHAATDADDSIPEAWNMRGYCLVRWGTARLARGDPRGRQNLQEAMRCFRKTLEIDPDHQGAMTNRKLLRLQLRDLEKGRLWSP